MDATANYYIKKVHCALNWSFPPSFTLKQRLVSLISSISVGILLKFATAVPLGFPGSVFLATASGLITYCVLTSLFKKAQVSTPIEAINSVKIEKEHPSEVYTADVILHSRTKAFVGNHREYLLEDELQGWKMSDGSELPLEKNTLVLQFRLFNRSTNFQNSCPKFSFFLPTFLFEGKKEGETISLCYNNNVLNLKLAPIPFTKGRGTFETIFNDLKSEAFKELAEEKLDDRGSEFDICMEHTNDPWVEVCKFLPFSNKSISPKNIQLTSDEHKGKAYEFIPLAENLQSPKKIQLTPEKVVLNLDTENIVFKRANNGVYYLDDKLILQFDMPGVYQLYFILNEKCLFITAKEPGDRVVESIVIFQWKTFFDQSLEEVQAFIQKADCQCNGDGTFSIKFPKPKK
jgi:hypothetical protein